MTEDCDLCKMARGEIGAEVVKDFPSWLAIRETSAHIVVFPREHLALVTRYSDGEPKVNFLSESLLRVVATAAHAARFTDYRLVLDVGVGATHFPVHVLAGVPSGSGGS